MRLLALPTSNDALDLADWLEIRALLADDGNASRGDLESALRAAPSFAGKGAEAVEATLADVFAELSMRATASVNGYPFEIREGSVAALRRRAWTTRSAYLVCLCMTVLGDKAVLAPNVYPTRFFEDLAVDAAKAYVGGEGFRFGHPRRGEMPVGFKRAVEEFVRLVGEGESPRSGLTQSAKDGGLDVVAWKAHPDGYAGKIVLFGACATGGDWKAKRQELSIHDWQSSALAKNLAVDPVRAFFVPRRLPGEWYRHLTKAGIVFDRCRISHWAPRAPNGVHGDPVRWAQAQLKALPKA